MATSLNSLGSISQHLYNLFPNLPSGFSGLVLLEISDMARQHVANYTGKEIGSNGISDIYQGAILDYAKADLIDLINAQPGGESLRLGELSMTETGNTLTSEQYRALGEMKLRAIGRNYQVLQALS